MHPKTLRVRANGDTLVQNYERLDMGVNAFIGRTYKELKPASPDDGLNAARVKAGFTEFQAGYGFIGTDEVVEVPMRAEYVKALKDGDLLPADDETAKVAGIKRELPSGLRQLTDSRPPPRLDTKGDR